jgi:hypothetical protein
LVELEADPLVQAAQELSAFLDVDAETQSAALGLADDSVEFVHGGGLPVRVRDASQVHEQQVQGGEPLLAVHEIPGTTRLFDVDERTHEEPVGFRALPATATSLPVVLEGADEIVHQGPDVVGRPRVLTLVVVDLVKKPVEQVFQAEVSAGNRSTHKTSKIDGTRLSSAARDLSRIVIA